MNDLRHDDALKELLRAGDPAGDGSEPTADELATLRRATLNALPESRRTRWFPLAVATTALALVVVLLTPERTVETPTPPTSSAAVTDVQEPETTALATRRQQVQFSTTNGTRIVWVLDPDLNL